MYFVYIIKSKNVGRYYIGMTANILRRISYHDRGANKSTRNKGPWTLVYKEVFKTKKDACLRERQIKKYKGGNAFKKLIVNA